MRKWFLIAVALLAALTVAVVVVISQNLESYLNDNKQLFIEQIEATLGRNIEIGRIGLSFGSGLGVRVEGLEIAEDPAIAEGNFLTAEAIEVRVKILPALRGRYEVGRIGLSKPEIVLVQTPAGMNIATLGGGSTDADTDSPAAATGGGAQAAALAIALFDVSDGRVRYIDATQAPPIETIVEHLHFSASDISTTAPLVFEMSAALGGADEPNLFASGSVGPVATDDPSNAPLDLTVSVDSVTGQQVASLSILAASLPPELQIDGPLELEATLTGTLSAMAVTAAGRANEADLRYGDSFHKPVGTAARFSLSATRGLERITLNDSTEAVIGPVRTAVAGTVTTADAMSLDLRAVANPFPIKELSQILPNLGDADLEGRMGFDLQITSAADGTTQIAGTVGLDDAGLRQPDMPTVRGLTTKIKLRPDALELPPSTFFVGDAEARISAAVADFDAPKGTLSVHAPMLTPTSLGLSAIGEKGDRLETVALEARIATERDTTRLQGTLNSAAGQISGIAYTNLTAKFSHADGRVTLDPASLSAFGGTLTANGDMAVGEGVDQNFKLRVRTEGVDVKRLSAWASPAGGRLLGGQLDAGIDLRGTAGAWEKTRTTLAGNGKLTLRDGRIEDVNIAEDVLRAVTGIPGLSNLLSPRLKQNYPGLFSTGATEFQTLATSVDMINGRMSTRDLKLEARDYAIAADGNIGLDRSVDLNARLIASKQLSRDLIDSIGAVKFLADRSGRVEIPFTLKGDVTSAQARPDGAVIARALQRALVGGITDKLFGY